MTGAESYLISGRERPLAELMDPVALERRLEAARVRRAAALARNRTGAAAAPAPLAALSAFAARSLSAARGARMPGFLAGLAAGLALAAAVLVVPWRPAEPPATWQAIAAASRAPEPVRLALAAPTQPVRAAPPAALVPPGVAVQTALRPEPRPEQLRSAPTAPVATRSARNRPGGAPPPTVAGVVRGLNAATLGRAAATLGMRERVALPGLTISLDRRGLRLKPHPAKVKRGRGG